MDRRLSVTKRIGESWEAISPTAKAAFFTALIMGVVVHATGITNLLLNHDSILGIAQGTGIDYTTQGKWFAHVVSKASGAIDHPNTSLILGLLFISITSGITVSFLRLRSRLFSGLIGAMMITFPTVVSTNSYIGASVFFFFSLLLSCLTAYFAEQKKYGFILSICFLTVSLGTYQAYIGYVTGLFLLRLIIEAFRRTYKTKDFILCGIKYIVILLCSMTFYYIILQIRLQVTGTELSAYRGISEMTSIRFQDIPVLIIGAYKKVINFYFFDLYGENEFLSAWLYRSILLCVIGLYISLIVKTKLYQDKWQGLFSAILMALFPLAIHLIAVLGQNTNTHWCMIYSFVLIPIMMVAFMDVSDQCTEETTGGILKSITVNHVLSTITIMGLVIGSLQCYIWFLVTGECYAALRLSNSAAYAASIELCSDLNDAGYDSTMPLALIGDGKRDTEWFQPEPESFHKTQYTGITTSNFVTHSGYQLLSWYLQHILGYDFVPANSTQVSALCKQEEVFWEMPIYPEEGSIREIDGIMVVKLSHVGNVGNHPVITDANKNTFETEDPVVIYEVPNHDLKLKAGNDEKFKCQVLCNLTTPEDVFCVSCDNVRSIAGDAESVDVIVYNRTLNRILAIKSFDLNQPFEWIFRTTKYVANNDYQKYEVLVYAGNRGLTQGNEIVFENLTVERLSDEITSVDLNEIDLNESILLYEAPNHELILKAGNEKFKCQVLYHLTTPEDVFHVSCDNVRSIAGDAESVDVIVYNRALNLVAASKSFDLNQPFEWTFKTTEYVANSDYQKYEVLVYAGNRGLTQGNEIIFENLTVEHLSDEIT